MTQRIGQSQRPSTQPASDATPSSSARGPVGQGRHVVRQGECVSSIAHQRGLDPKQVWDHADNAELRERRGDPSMLLPGDRLALPEPRERTSFSISPGGTHTFKATIPSHEIKLELKDGSEPRRNKRCTLVIDGVTSETTTNAQGILEFRIHASTRYGTLTIHEEKHGHTFDETFRLDFGGLDPATEVSGVQSRLRSLGFNVGPVDGELGPRTREALEHFQRKNDLSVTGEPDQATQDKLVELFGA